ncbi:MAG: histidine kinase N-terminal 7TM domain-containing protein [bacterium]
MSRLKKIFHHPGWLYAFGFLLGGGLHLADKLIVTAMFGMRPESSAAAAFASTLLFTLNFAVYIFLLLHWVVSLHLRLLPSRERTYILLAAVMMLFFLLERAVRYRVALPETLLEHITWYGYYIPLAVIPSMFLLTCLSVERESRVRKGFRIAVIALCAFFVLAVATNDLHMGVFRPLEDGKLTGVWGDYSYGPLYYAFYAYVGLCILLGVVILAAGDRRRGSGRRALPALLCLLLMFAGMLAFDGIVDVTPWRFPETAVFFLLGCFESCIATRLIPSNENYAAYFAGIRFPAVITDCNFQPVYQTAAGGAILRAESSEAANACEPACHSEEHPDKESHQYSSQSRESLTENSALRQKFPQDVSAGCLDKECFPHTKGSPENVISMGSNTDGMLSEAVLTPVDVGAGRVLHGKGLSSGYVFYLSDESVLRALNEELADVAEALEGENDLLRYENKQKEERARIDARNAVYARASKEVYEVQKRISVCLDQAKPGTEDFQKYIARALLLSAYVKRKTNFVLTYGTNAIESKESLQKETSALNRKPGQSYAGAEITATKKGVVEKEAKKAGYPDEDFLVTKEGSTAIFSSEELFLALKESARFLALSGIAASVEKTAERSFSYTEVTRLYDTFEIILEALPEGTSALAITLGDGEISLLPDCGDFPIPSDLPANVTKETEDGQLYLTISLMA